VRAKPVCFSSLGLAALPGLPGFGMNMNMSRESTASWLIPADASLPLASRFQAAALPCLTGSLGPTHLSNQVLDKSRREFSLHRGA
jgi:hypothetical protein